MATDAVSPSATEAVMDSKADGDVVPATTANILKDEGSSIAEEKKQAEDEGVVVAQNPFAPSSEGATSAAAAPEIAKSSQTSEPVNQPSKEDADGPLSPPGNANNSGYNDDEDSSNDDSSYFADPNNLPSPGEAGRKYSYGSNVSSNKAPTGRESDASLSLSDDSDDNHHGGSKGAFAQSAPEVFPHQRITRMHSVGSLVSASSQNSDDAARDFGKKRRTVSSPLSFAPNTDSNHSLLFQDACSKGLLQISWLQDHIRWLRDTFIRNHKCLA